MCLSLALWTSMGVCLTGMAVRRVNRLLLVLHLPEMPRGLWLSLCFERFARVQRLGFSAGCGLVVWLKSLPVLDVIVTTLTPPYPSPQNTQKIRSPRSFFSRFLSNHAHQHVHKLHRLGYSSGTEQSRAWAAAANSYPQRSGCVCWRCWVSVAASPQPCTMKETSYTHHGEANSSE